MEVKKFNKIEIVPNSTDGVDVSIDGEKVDLEDITELTLGIAKDTDGNFSCFELSAKKRLCFLTTTRRRITNGKENT